MQPTLPLWFQRLPPERVRRLELAVAGAIEARLDTHAEQALNLVAVLSPRMSFDHAVERYVEMMGLGSDEGQVVQTRALVALAESDVTEELARKRRPQRMSWRYATPLGAVRFVRRKLRRNAEEDLWLELSAARAEEAIVRTHVKHALNFIHILEDLFPPTRAVSLYLEQLEVPSSRARTVYQRTLARVAAVELPGSSRVSRVAEALDHAEPFRLPPNTSHNSCPCSLLGDSTYPSISSGTSGMTMRFRLQGTRPTPRAAFLFTVFLTLAGCSDDPVVQADDAEPVDSVVVVSAPQEPVGPASDLPPNELGEIMVLEYHRLGEPENEWRRTAANFHADLQRLYDAGYRPITVRQMVEGDIDLPRGTTPVVFTIDDSSTGQFYLLDDGSIDPNTMVGIWDEFSREHPEWEGGAVWCVLPAADHPSNFFGELPSREVPRDVREERIQQKVDHLVSNGHEICNHTLYHARLDRAVSDAQVQEWIGRGEDSIQVYLPDDYDIVTLGLPLGMWPETRSLAWEGTYNGKPYSYDAVLEVTGGPNESPFDIGFEPMSITRVIVTPNALERNLNRYDENPGVRYVSDGEAGVISVRAEQADRVDRERWSDRKIRVVGAAP